MRILSVEVSDQFARDVLTTAIEAGSYGSGYWLEVEEVARSSDHSIVGVRGVDREADEPRAIDVDIAKIKTAIAAIVSNPAGTHCAGIVRAILDDNTDGGDCDAILQVAAFGEAVYS